MDSGGTTPCPRRLAFPPGTGSTLRASHSRRLCTPSRLSKLHLPCARPLVLRIQHIGEPGYPASGGFAKRDPPFTRAHPRKLTRTWVLGPAHGSQSVAASSSRRRAPARPFSNLVLLRAAQQHQHTDDSAGPARAASNARWNAHAARPRRQLSASGPATQRGAARTFPSNVRSIDPLCVFKSRVAGYSQRLSMIQSESSVRASVRAVSSFTSALVRRAAHRRRACVRRHVAPAIIVCIPRSEARDWHARRAVARVCTRREGQD